MLVLLVVAVAVGVFNGVVVAVSAYFGPFMRGMRSRVGILGFGWCGMGLWLWGRWFGVAGGWGGDGDDGSIAAY